MSGRNSLLLKETRKRSWCPSQYGVGLVSVVIWLSRYLISGYIRLSGEERDTEGGRERDSEGGRERDS